MALLWNDGRGLNLQLEEAEYATIKRALVTALERARDIEASADEADLVRLMGDLGITVTH